MTTIYTACFNESQRVYIQLAMARLADDLNAGRVPNLHASDPAPADCFGSCVGEEVEALRDMLRTDTDNPLMPGDCVNGLCL